MLNLRGADLLWPSAVRMVMPGNKDYRMEVGSKAEMVLLVSLLAIALLLYPVSGIGFRHGLTNLLGSFKMAQEQFVKNAGQRWYSLRMEATDNLTLERVTCECPVVGTWRNGLIVLEGGELRAVGESQEAHNLYPNHVELIEGEPLRVLAQRGDMRGRPLRWLLDLIGTGRTVYLSGELRMGSRLDPQVEDLDRYRPARFVGEVLRLRYARPADLGR
jgi:inner membrane protein